jgi:hypothetical protein
VLGADVSGAWVRLLAQEAVGSFAEMRSGEVHVAQLFVRPKTVLVFDRVKRRFLDFLLVFSKDIRRADDEKLRIEFLRLVNSEEARHYASCVLNLEKVLRPFVLQPHYVDVPDRVHDFLACERRQVIERRDFGRCRSGLRLECTCRTRGDSPA